MTKENIEKALYTHEMIEQNVVGIDEKMSLASIAISLRRIADAMHAISFAAGAEAAERSTLRDIYNEVNAYVAHNVPNHYRNMK